MPILRLKALNKCNGNITHVLHNHYDNVYILRWRMLSAI